MQIIAERAENFTATASHAEEQSAKIERSAFTAHFSAPRQRALRLNHMLRAPDSDTSLYKSEQQLA